MSEDIIDMRAAIRAKRKRCDHNYVVQKNGIERCELCRDCFPCAGLKCTHLDCIARAIKLKIRYFPEDFPVSVYIVAPKHRGPNGAMTVWFSSDPNSGCDDCAACAINPEDHFTLLVDIAEGYEKWILPPGWRAP